MKKTLAILLCLAMMVAMLAGCGGKEAAPAGESYKIALITMDRVDQHWVTLDEGAQKAAAELGVEVVNMSPNAKDDAQQIEQINNAVSSGCQAIVVAANGPDAVSSALKEAVAAGVIGGISPLGGTGLLLGTLAGAGVWQTLENGLGIIGAPVGIQRIVIGLIVTGAVLFDVVVRQGVGSKKKAK